MKYTNLDEWIEETVIRDLEWFRNIKSEYTRIRNDHGGLLSEGYREAHEKADNFLRNNCPKYIARDIRFGATDEDMEKMFRRDAEDRKTNLLRRLEKKAGNILEFDVYRNDNGGLDGRVTGDVKSVSVTTIVAGGYNIQRAHYRTLIN